MEVRIEVGTRHLGERGSARRPSRIRCRSRIALLGASALATAAAALAAAPLAAPVAAPAAGASLTATRFGTDVLSPTRPGNIVIARSDGNGSRILTRGWFSFVSPDDSQVGVIDSDANFTNLRLELYASSGGAPTHVIDIDCTDISWSPDSTRLACVEPSATGKPFRLLLIDATSAATTVLASGFFDRQVSFSPDSSQLAFVQYPTAKQAQYSNSNGKLRLIDLATKATSTVRATGAASPVWGPTAIAFSTVKSRGSQVTFDVAVIRPDGTGFRQLTRFQPNTELYGLYPTAWSADGRRLLGGVRGLDAWTSREAYGIDPIRGGSHLVAHGVSPAALSRDGRYVIGQTGDAESTGLARSSIVRVPWVGGKPRVLLRQAVQASYSG